MPPPFVGAPHMAHPRLPHQGTRTGSLEPGAVLFMNEADLHQYPPET